MQTDGYQANIAPEDIKKKFDETLIRHMDQNMGTGHGRSRLSLDMTTVSCLVVLSEKEMERQSFPSDPPQRYTLDSILEELEEMGLDDHEAVRQKIKEMLDKGYIHTEADGTLLPSESTMDMTGLVDRAFSGMPGMNLVAYLVQTLHEALSGRKDPGFALAQLDQTLTMYGGGLSRAPLQAKQGLMLEKGAVRKSGGQSAEALKSALSATLRKRQAGAKNCNRGDSAGRRRIVAAGGPVKTIRVKEVFPKQDHVSGGAGGSLEENDVQGQATLEASEAACMGDGTSGAAVDTEAKGLPGDSQKPSDMTPDGVQWAGQQPTETRDRESLQTKDAQEEVLGQQPDPSLSAAMGRKDNDLKGAAEGPCVEEVHDETGANPRICLQETVSAQQDMPSLNDEALESRITAFEQDLAMTCPVCSKGKIETKETAKGKTYYVCTQQDCVFVSWGRPFHLECPWCKNPFLIETTAKVGKNILRCPRATCRYQQGLPGEQGGSLAQAPSTARALTPSTRGARGTGKKKRVVRRRVVRRKR